MNRIRKFLARLHENFWVLPMLIVLFSIGLAVFLTRIEIPEIEDNFAWWPLLTGTGADGAREVMSTIAGSMMTVLGVTFSMILVVLSLASNQYTTRILRNFIRDRVTQTVLGIFSGIFTYCIVVLRAIRGGDNEFIPNLAISFGFVLALLGVVTFTYFLHHIAQSIVATNIIASITEETVAVIDRLFPEPSGQEATDGRQETVSDPLAALPWQPVLSKESGYIQSVRIDALLKQACESDTVIRMERGIGDFVVEGTPLASLKLEQPPESRAIHSLLSEVLISPHRTVEQDVAFGIRQIVDVALKALSPAVVDTTTAITCVDYLTVILARLAPRSIPSPERHADGRLRMIVKGPDFPDLLGTAFNQIRGLAEGDPAILSRLIGSLHVLAGLTKNTGCRQAIEEQGRWIDELAERTLAAAHDRAAIQLQLAQLRSTLAS